MIRTFVLYMLGPWGRQALQFYLDHSLWINGVVVIYGALLAIAHLNLRRLEARAVETLLRMQSQGKQDRHREAPSVSWEHIIAGSSFFPFVAGKTGLIPRRCRPEVLERLIPASRLQSLLNHARLENDRNRTG